MTLGSPTVDRCLDGGIPCQSITEIVAESGSGKTQLCLQLVLLPHPPSSLGSLSDSSIYLHSEFPFPHPPPLHTREIIVINSIAALFRSEFDNNSVNSRCFCRDRRMRRKKGDETVASSCVCASFASFV
ncbi:DNA repair protein XRCC3 homolog [Linum perenne]